jgi:hypothetical protein
MSTSEQGWAQRLARRPLLWLKPWGCNAIKRDVHCVEVDCEAAGLTQAFHDKMIDPCAHFGLISVRRPCLRTGKPFRLHDRFQGRYSLKDSIIRAVRKSMFGGLEPLVDGVCSAFGVRQVLGLVEDNVMSDYGEIVELNLTATPYRLKYVYLVGSPIAGSSTFVIEDLVPGPDDGWTGPRCRVTQTFEYQELNFPAMASMATWALKIHDEVVYQQVSQSAETMGHKVVATDIPEEYR